MTHLQMLVNSQQQKAEQVATQAVDWPKRKDKWLDELDKLNVFIRASLMGAGVPKNDISFFDKAIQEETLGAYTAKGIEARIGDAIVRFTPVGSVLIGALGRVDVSSTHARGGTVRLIADAAHSDLTQANTPSYQLDWEWSVYPNRSRSAGYSLDEEGLAKALESVLAGR